MDEEAKDPVEIDEESELVELLEELSVKVKDLENQPRPDISKEMEGIKTAHQQELQSLMEGHKAEIKGIRDEIARILHESQ